MISAERWSPADGLTLEPNAMAAATETRAFKFWLASVLKEMARIRRG